MTFKLPDESIAPNEAYTTCVSAIDYNNEHTCAYGHRNGDVKVNIVNLDSPSGIGRVGDINKDTTYYDENGNVIPNSYVKQGDDSINTDKDQGSGIGVSFGDNSDHNTINIDQRSTFADVIRDLVPIAKEGAHMAKDTAAQLLN